MEEWQRGDHELYSRRCATVRSVRWIGTEFSNFPTFDGLIPFNIFFNDIEINVAEHQWLPLMDVALKPAPARWYAAHQNNLYLWNMVKSALLCRFYDSEPNHSSIVQKEVR